MIKTILTAFIIIFFLNGCIREKDYLCSDFFIQSKKESVINQKIFTVKSEVDSIGGCRYNLAFSSWQGVTIANIFHPEFTLEGPIFWESNKIILIPKGYKRKVILFDFNINPGDSVPIKYFFITNALTGGTLKLNKNYNLKLNVKFYDSFYKDTLYKFCFNNYGYRYKGDDLHFIVGKKVGVLGIYATLKKGGDNCIYTKFGDIIFFKKEAPLLECDDIL